MNNVSRNCMISAMPTCERHGCRREAKRKFCSEDCKIAYHNAQRDRTNSEKKKCLACGKSFIGRPNKVTCSDSCRQKLFKIRKVKVKATGRRPRTGVTISVEKGG